MDEHELHERFLRLAAVFGWSYQRLVELQRDAELARRLDDTAHTDAHGCVPSTPHATLSPCITSPPKSSSAYNSASPASIPPGQESEDCPNALTTPPLPTRMPACITVRTHRRSNVTPVLPLYDALSPGSPQPTSEGDDRADRTTSPAAEPHHLLVDLRSAASPLVEINDTPIAPCVAATTQDSDSDVPLSSLRRRPAAPLLDATPALTRHMASLQVDSSPSSSPSPPARRPGLSQRRRSGVRARYCESEASESSDEPRVEPNAENDDSDGDGEDVDDQRGDAYDFDDGFLVPDDYASDGSGSAADRDGTSSDSGDCDEESSHSADEQSSDGMVASDSGAAPMSQLRNGEIDAATRRVYISVELGARSCAEASARDAVRGFRSRAVRDNLTRALFEEYNRNVFQGMLPAGMEVTWGPRLTKTAGLTFTSKRQGVDRVARIVLSVKVLDTLYKLATTLLHELCHAAAWLVDGVNRPPHGAAFARWAREATRAYPLRAVTTCHSFSVAFPIHMQCLACGRVKGRHTAPAGGTAVCACGGTMTVSGTTGALDAPTPSAARPRAPNAYAQFVAAHMHAVRDSPAVRKAGSGAAAAMREIAKLWRSAREPAPSGAEDGV